MEDPAFPFYAGDFLTGVMHLTMEERGIYITLLAYQWAHEEIPKKRLGLLVGCSWDNFPEELKDKFEDLGDVIKNPRLEAEREKRAAFKHKQRENGKKGGRPKNPKKTQTITQMETQKKPLENENDNEDENGIENEKRSRQNFLGLIRVYLEVEKKYIWDDDDDYHSERIRNKLRKLLKREQHEDGIPTANLSDHNCFTRFRKIIEGLNPWFAANRFSLKNIDKDFNTLIQDHEPKDRTNSKQPVSIAAKTTFSNGGEL